MSYIHSIDWQKTLLLIDASIQAYRAYDKRPAPVAPPGFEIVDTWTGFDAIFGDDRTDETYGVVMRSISAPYRYVFAFRGTDSVMDMIDDLGVEKKQFRPFDAGVAVPAGVEVESGFFDVYTTGDATKPPMQKQLFALLDKYQSSAPIDELWITGHSLGAALSELFSLDIALSRPTIHASNVNFACPRVGNAAFVALYQEQAAEQNPTSRTVRVQNVFDRIPCVPPESMGYEHVAEAYLIQFYKKGWMPDFGFIVQNHAAANYQAVLQCAATSQNKMCVRESLSVPFSDYPITSEVPEPNKVCQPF